MNRKSVLFASTLAILANGALADEATKKEKIAKLIEAAGFKEQFSRSIEIQKAQATKLSNDLLDKMTRDILADAKTKARLDNANQAYMGSLMEIWSADKAASSFGAMFGARFTEAELEKLLQFYGSDLGKKTVQASKETLVEFTEAFGKDAQIAFPKAIEAYSKELEKILADCCRPKDVEKGQKK